MLASPGFGATSVTGALLAFGHVLASYLCWRAWRVEATAARSRNDHAGARAARVWLALAAILALLALAKLLHVSPQITELGRHLARAQGWYARRRMIQAGAVVVAVALAAWGARAAVRAARRASSSLRRAITVGGALIALLAVRVLSLHHTDALLNLRFAGLALSEALEAAALVALGALALRAARAFGVAVAREGKTVFAAIGAVAALGATLAVSPRAGRGGGGDGAGPTVKLQDARTTSAPAGRADAIGGGFLAAGLLGEYFDAAEPTGTPAFTRRDVRVDFDWRVNLRPGGSTSPTFARVRGDRFAVRWTGQIVPRFSERYTFHVRADGAPAGARLAIRPAGTGAWTTLVDAWSSPGDKSSPAFALTAGAPYDLRLEYHRGAAPARLQLAWSSASTPREVIDPVSTSGVNVDTYRGYLGSALWADAMKGGRWRWVNPDNEGQEVKLDDDGWPTADAANYAIEGAVQAGGTYHLAFEGSAEIETFPTLRWTAGGQRFEGKVPKGAGYDARANETHATIEVPNETPLVLFRFRQTQRSPRAGVNTGIRAVRLLRPVAPGAARTVEPGTLFDAGLEAFFAKFTTLRWILNFDKEAHWSERTKPAWSKVYREPAPPPWEHAIMLSNETGRDLYLCVPIAADDEYVAKLARVVRYGSNARGEPYDRDEPNPVHPPLDSNLRVYLERGNEVWNWGFSQAGDNAQLARAAVANDTPDGRLINYDHKVDRNGGDRLWVRWHALRTKQISDAFRQTFGDEAMHRRVRVLLEYQYDDGQESASEALGFLDRVFNNADGVAHVKDPHPPAHFLWGGGAATYYGSGNARGTQTAVKLGDPGFDAKALAPGAVARGGNGPGWRADGDAGVFRMPELHAALTTKQPGRSTPGKGNAVGVKLTVGPQPIAIYALGRLIVAGNNRQHTIRIIRASDKNPIAEAYVQPKDTPAGQTAWAHLGHPVTLPAGTTFYLMSEEYGADGDAVYEDGVFSVDGALRSPAPVSATTGTWDTHAWKFAEGADGASGRGLGPANLRYTVGAVGGPGGIGFPPPPLDGEQAAFVGAGGTLTLDVDFGASPETFALEAHVAGRGDEPAGLDFFFDDQRITPYSGGRDPRVNPQPFVGGRYSYDVHDLLPYTTAAFRASGPHRLRIVGRGKPGQHAYLDKLSIVSVDAILAGGVPSAGEAFGQVAVDAYNTQMTLQARHARTYGLAPVAYEGGWSVGGDFAATVVQSHAKYLDPRAKSANDRAIELVDRAGYALNVFGTYDLWPTAYDSALNAARFPLVASVIATNDRLRAVPTVGAVVPAVLDGARPSWPARRDKAVLMHVGELYSYDVVARTSAPFEVAVTTAGHGRVRVLVDGGLAWSAVGPAGRELVASGVRLAAGAHAIGVQLVEGSATVERLRVSAPGAPATPAVRVAGADDRAIDVAWDAVPGAAGYLVAHGAAAGSPTDELDVGAKLAAHLTGLPAGRPRYVSVRAYGPNGVGMPSREEVVVPIAAGQTSLLAAWSTKAARGDEEALEPSLRGARLTISALRRAAGLRRAKFAPSGGADVFASEAVDENFGATAEQAARAEEAYEVTIAPAPDQSLSLAKLVFHAFFQNAGGLLDPRAAAVAYKLPGAATFSAPIAARGKASGSPTPHEVDLTTVRELQRVRGPVTLRIVLFGLRPYEYAGLGGGDGAIELSGTVSGSR